MSRTAARPKQRSTYNVSRTTSSGAPGTASPLDIALAIATNEKNLFGSIVEVTDSVGYAEIRRSRCALLEGASAFSRLGATLIAKEHCKTCRESHWRKVFSELGVTMESEEIDGGCVMKLSKQ